MRLDGAINMAVRRLPLVIALLALCVGSSRADFIDGLAAYDGGDYETVLAEWRPLAEAGDPEAQVALAGLYLTGTGVAADPGLTNRQPKEQLHPQHDRYEDGWQILYLI